MLSQRTSMQSRLPEARTAVPFAPSLWALCLVEPSCAREIEQLLEQISELSTAEWLEIGARVNWQSGSLLAAQQSLQTLVADPELAATAWYVHDLATTCTWSCRCSRVCAPKRDRRLLDLARDAAICAALALLARRRLSSEDFELLYAPIAAMAAAHPATPADGCSQQVLDAAPRLRSFC